MAQQGTGFRMNGLLVGLLAGAAIGAAIGMLYAPRAGRETRAVIRKRIAEWRARTGGKEKQLTTILQRGEHDEDVHNAA